MKRIVMKNETRINSYIAGWSLAIFLAVAGVSTWYSTNKTMMGLALAVVLMAGFLFSLKVASAFLFDNRNSGGLRFASLVFLFCLVTIDIFGGSHSLQTGTMKRVVTETTSSSTYQSNLKTVQVLQDQLADCPPKYYTKCKKPLSKELAKATAELNKGSGTTGSVEAKFWLALTNAINSMSDETVEMHDVVFYTYVLIMAVASMLTIYMFGILGSALIDRDGDGIPDYDPREPDPQPTGTDDQSSSGGKDKDFGFIPNNTPTPATASSGLNTQATHDNQIEASATPTDGGSKQVELSTPPTRSGSEPFFGKEYDKDGTHYTPISNDDGQIVMQSRSGASVGDFSKAFEKRHQRPAPMPQIMGNLAIDEDLVTQASTSPLDLVDKVADKPNKVPTSLITKENSQVLNNDEYLVIRAAILGGKIKPSFPQSEGLQKAKKIGDNNAQRRQISQQVFDRMQEAEELVINPKWTGSKCGLSKYLMKGGVK